MPGIHVDQVKRDIKVEQITRGISVKRTSRNLVVRQTASNINVEQAWRNINVGQVTNELKVRRINRVIQVNSTGRRGPKGDQGETGSSAGFVFSEVPVGLKNDINVIFTTEFGYSPATTRVYLNGLRQSIPGDYSETAANQITMVEPPSSWHTLTIDYVKV